MKRLFWVMPLLAAGAAPAAAQDVQQRLETALGFEWYMANCEQALQANAMLAMGAAMTINGHTISDVSAARERVHAQVKERFPDPQDACDSYAANLTPAQ